MAAWQAHAQAVPAAAGQAHAQAVSPQLRVSVSAKAASLVISAPTVGHPAMHEPGASNSTATSPPPHPPSWQPASRARAPRPAPQGHDPDSSSAQPGRTSPALIAQREQRARNAAQLTTAIRTAPRWQQLEQIFLQQKGHMNHIHMSALMTRLAHLGELAPPHHHPSHPSQFVGNTNLQTAAGWSKQETPALKAFLATVVPYIGLHLLSLGPRQLANVMWALGSLGCRPQPAWLVEWSACVARKLHTFTPQDLAMSTWGLVACGAMELGTSTGAPGVLQQMAAAAAQPSICAWLKPRDISNVCWALAVSGIKPEMRLLQALVGQANQALERAMQAGASHQTMPERRGQVPDSFSPQELANLLWALAKLGFWPGDPLLMSATHCFLNGGGVDRGPGSMQQGLQQAATDQPPGMAAAALNVAGPMGLMHNATASNATPQQQPHTGFTRRRVHALPEPRHHAVMLWALARLHARPEPEQVACLLAGSLGLPYGDRAHPVRTLRYMRGADLAQIVWALGRLQYQPDKRCWPVLMTAIILALQATGAVATGELTVPVEQQVLAMAGLGTHQTKAIMWRQACWRERRKALTRERTEANPGAHTLEALARKARAAGTMEGMGALTAPELVSVLWGLCWLRTLRLPPVLQQAIRLAAPQALGAIAPQLERVPVRSLLHLATSCALLHIQPPALFMSAWAERCAPSVAALNAQQLARLLLALVLMKHRPAREGRTTSHDVNAAEQGPDGDEPPVVRPAAHLGRAAFLLEIEKRAFALMHNPERLQRHATVSGPATAATPVATGAARTIHQVQSMFPLVASGQDIVTDPQPRSARSSADALGNGPDALGIKQERLSGPDVPRDCVEGEGLLEDLGMTYRWQGSGSSLVMVLWALGKLRAGPVGRGWANAAAVCSGQAAHALRPPELPRLVEGMRLLRMRPSPRVGMAMAARLRAAAAARAVVLRCDEPCHVGDEEPCASSSCYHLRSVPDRLESWRLMLVSDEAKQSHRGSYADLVL